MARPPAGLSRRSARSGRRGRTRRRPLLTRDTRSRGSAQTASLLLEGWALSRPFLHPIPFLAGTEAGPPFLYPWDGLAIRGIFSSSAAKRLWTAQASEARLSFQTKRRGALLPAASPERRKCGAESYCVKIDVRMLLAAPFPVSF